MIKNSNKKRKICALLLSCLIGVTSSMPVIAAEEAANMASSVSEEYSGIETYGYYIEPCWICNNGDIYRDTQYISKHFDHAELCGHGYTKGTDNYYNYTYALVYTCDNCDYGWAETITRTIVECEGHY